MQRALIAASLFALLNVSCGGKTEMGSVIIVGGGDASTIDSSVPAEAGTSTDAIVQDSCGPTDGPAIAVVSSKGIVCPGSVSASGTYTMINVFPIPTGPGTIVLTPMNSEVSHCSLGNCVLGGGGTLTFTTFSPNGNVATGSFNVKFADGTTSSGTFSAPQCHQGGMCG
jgi:hypothetical protein